MADAVLTSSDLRAFLARLSQRQAAKPEQLTQVGRHLVDAALRVRRGGDGVYGEVEQPATKQAEAIGEWLRSLEESTTLGGVQRTNEAREAVTAAAEELDQAVQQMPAANRLRPAVYGDALGAFGAEERWQLPSNFWPWAAVTNVGGGAGRPHSRTAGRVMSKPDLQLVPALPEPAIITPRQDLLPDSRANVTRGIVKIDGVNYIPIFCANCGVPQGGVPEGATFAFWLCDKCFETHGAVAGTYAVPDEVFWQRAHDELIEKYGRIPEMHEMVQMEADPNSMLSKLAREAPKGK